MTCPTCGRGRGAQAKPDHVRHLTCFVCGKAFEQRAIVFPSLDSGNAVAFGAAGEPVEVTLDEMRERARQLKTETGLDLRPTISRLQKAQTLPGGCLKL